MKTNDAAGLQVAIVDADEGARRKLRALLESMEPLRAVHEAGSPFEAARLIVDARPDLVFLDVDLPGAAAIPALRAPDAPCVAVIASGPQLALQGFDFEAIDYLVRPLARERLAGCLARARKRLAERRIAALALEIAAAAAAIRGVPSPRVGASRYPDQMTIRVRRRMFALAVDDIAWIEGASQYSRVHARTGDFLLSRSLSSLECELDPERFFRIHRSAIVNAACVREVMSRGDGRYNVYLHGGEALPLGRARRDVLDRLLGGLKGRGDSPLWRKAPAVAT
jgi:two-component system LytT family response regulator